MSNQFGNPYGYNPMNRRQRRREERRQRRMARRQRRSNRDCSPDCDCGGCDLMLTFSMVLKAVLGMFRPLAFTAGTALPSSPGARFATRLVRSYQVNVAAQRTRYVCHMTPSCSAYAMEAVSRHGVIRGGFLTIGRLRRCGRPRGADPVPD
ncbi:membrane protein insertion efficiency factor YidD [Nocardioides speluncae]|uniref:membrane protein insertion efficiency factor YidD n=1 Tax=Nocardioides speluncae TaxID=2670337 RepID=UPI001F0C5B31|nr:membrane protein insertion efficiency factor YidD [Nocardioides speluncae]